MILRFLLIAGFCLISPTWGSMSREDFEEFIESICLPKPDLEAKLLINGQENPLSQTIENFIALAEKFEADNPTIGLQNELFYFIRGYTYDNIEYTRLGDIVRWEPKDARMDEVKNFWEPDEGLRTRQLDVEDPFTNSEKCSLFHMISHSIIRMPRKVDAQRSYTNDSRDSIGHQFDLDNQYPMEQGVVAIQGSNMAVDLGRVLRGMYVGLQADRRVDLSSIQRIPKQLFDGHSRELDRLYALTLSEVIALSTWRPEVGLREKLAQDGYWVSAPIGSNNLNTSDICPMIYKLKANESAAFSYSSMRGAADGFILGKIVDNILAKNSKVKLSQILRQYYSRGGIFETDAELGGSIWASFCNRESIISSIEETLKEQTYLYQLLVAVSYKYIPDPFTWDYYQSQKSSIFGIYNTAIRDYCSKLYNIEQPENFPRETPLDIIAVIDTSEVEFIKKQQLILGYFAKEMDLRYAGSRMTILTDQRVPSAAASAAGTVLLKPVVEDSFSSACAACAVTQISWEDSAPSAPEDDVIIGINQFLNARKANETDKNGVNGKVIIYFNLEQDQKNARPTPLQTRVEKALIDLRLNHIEVPIYPLGRSTSLVKKYARNDGAFVLSAVDEPEHVVARKLFQRISLVPATLQYPDCMEHRNERSAIFEYYVSPSAVQHWSMPAKYFYKSINMKIAFESKYGPIRVCHNRATPSPELQRVMCEDIDNGQRKEFVHSNPCKDFDAVSCSPFYFSVIGVNATSDKKGDCLDAPGTQCRTLDQTYFKVTHEGVRCNGSAAIMANAALLLLGAVLLNFLSKKC